MKKLIKKFEDMMVSITFAEAGEYDLVKEMLADEWTTERALPVCSEEVVHPVQRAT